MASVRLPGVICGFKLPDWINLGTLCRSRSFAPNILIGPLQQQTDPSSQLNRITGSGEVKSETGPFSVKAGQVTFDAEGNDDVDSIYFSRMIHWPGNDLSGVTLGRGYDMGDRDSNAVEGDLVAAGLTLDRAKQFAEGAGKKGAQAKAFCEDNRELLGEISPDVQKNLFNRIYPGYVERARKNYDRWTLAENERTAWELLDQPIRDVLVDFVYQGFTKGGNPMKMGMRNDYDELITYIKESPTLKRYEAGRNLAGYLRKHKPIP